jgi:hypothetical protein
MFISTRLPTAPFVDSAAVPLPTRSSTRLPGVKNAPPNAGYVEGDVVGLRDDVGAADELAVMELEGVWLVEAPSVPELVGVTVGVELTEGRAGAHATPTSVALTEPAPDT